MRHLVNTPDTEVVTFPLINVDNIDPIRRALLTELWGVDISSFAQGSMNTLKLPKTPLIELTTKKLRSLAKKYFSIPVKYLPYFPCITQDLQESDNEEEAGSDTRSKKLKKKISRMANGVVPPVKKKVGRPKKNVVMAINQPSILRVFSKNCSEIK